MENDIRNLDAVNNSLQAVAVINPPANLPVTEKNHHDGIIVGIILVTLLLIGVLERRRSR